MRRFLGLAILIFSFNACASPEESPASSPRIIKPGDIILFRVVEWSEDLGPSSETVKEAKLEVGLDGKVLVPLAGTFVLRGKTLAEATAIVESPIMATNPRRSAHLAFPPGSTASGKTVEVSGAIAFPAQIPWHRGLTLGMALEACGGVLPEAHDKKISVVRSGKVLYVNGRDPEGKTFVLQSGDKLFVSVSIW